MLYEIKVVNLQRNIDINYGIMTYNAIDIAKKIIVRTDTEHGDSISNLKLQKLLYFMQGFHLAYFGEPLFKEDIKAWAYGPVVSEAYNKFKRYRKDAINPKNFTDDLQLSGKEQKLFDAVYQEYNQYSAIGLMNMTHNEGPWKSHELGEVITTEEIKAYFTIMVETGKSPIQISYRAVAKMPRMESDEALEALVRSRQNEDRFILKGETAPLDGLVAKTSGRLLKSMTRWL